jgi:hypothetical protein
VIIGCQVVITESVYQGRTGELLEISPPWVRIRLRDGKILLCAANLVKELPVMCEPKILNVNTTPREELTGAVYIGRGSKWGNPFKIGADGTRDEVIAKFAEYIDNHPALMAEARTELKGKDLVCFCKPLACHGDILLRIANGE